MDSRAHEGFDVFKSSGRLLVSKIIDLIILNRVYMVRSDQFSDFVIQNLILASYMHSSENFTKWSSRYVSQDLI